MRSVTNKKIKYDSFLIKTICKWLYLIIAGFENKKVSHMSKSIVLTCCFYVYKVENTYFLVAVFFIVTKCCMQLMFCLCSWLFEGYHTYLSFKKYLVIAAVESNRLCTICILHVCSKLGILTIFIYVRFSFFLFFTSQINVLCWHFVWVSIDNYNFIQIV